MHWSLRLLLVALVLATQACGRYTRGDGGDATATTGEVRVGEGFEAITTVSRPAEPTTTPIETEDTTVASNQSTYDSPEGFRLVLTVEGNLTYSSSDVIKLSVLVWNISSKDLQFDPNDLRNFAFRPFGSSKTAWTDGDCRGARTPKALETPAQTLKPNEQTTFVDVYPGPSDANSDQCRVDDGAYSVFGFVSWCPPGSTDGGGVCDPGRTRQISSRAVKIQIG